MSPRRPPVALVEARDFDHGRRVFDRLTARALPVASLTITSEEITVEAPPTLTPPKGIEVLREIEDDPTDDVIVHRGKGFADLIARVGRRRLRLRVTSRGRAR